MFIGAYAELGLTGYTYYEEENNKDYFLHRIILI